MVFLQYNSLEELNEDVSERIISELQQNKTALFCPATGNSPKGTYQKLVEKKERLPVESLRFIKLDEWYGLPMNYQGTCELYLQQRLLQPLGVKPEQYVGFTSDVKDAEAECERIQNYLTENGPVDLCILGIGKNGHIAFNEPREELHAGVHLSKLTPASLKHSMIEGVDTVLEYGLTLGMADILQSKKIFLIVNGEQKRDILNRFLSGNISTHLPASFLWLHPDVYCFWSEEG
ncbi:MAG TPA: galactosamine-6-phosphate isomerase [Chitinophagaceae bacterium]|nr:galactosamine-6-phosphate isomerase [Chitinophagaceae bacterium]